MANQLLAAETVKAGTPWLLNTPDGTIDLRTGHQRPHCLDDYLTKRTAVAPGGKCPRWRRFIQEITAGDGDLGRYLQRVAGYCLTGVTREQELFFLYGTGLNGKGVFLQTLSGLRGLSSRLQHRDFHRHSL